MRPLARLYITRQRIYEKECDETEQETINETEEGTDRKEEDFGSFENHVIEEKTETSTRRHPKCATTRFFDVTSCSVTCGTGFKTMRR